MIEFQKTSVSKLSISKCLLSPYFIPDPRNDSVSASDAPIPGLGHRFREDGEDEARPRGEW